MKLGQTTALVNVREGAGADQYPVTQYNGQKLQLQAGVNVIIVDEAKAGGKVWYHVLFYVNGVELDGWVTSSYVSVVGSVTSTPTPTPEPTDTPTPTPTSTPTPTPEITETPTPTQTPEKSKDKSPLYKLFWRGVIAILVLMVVIVVTIYIYNRVMISRGKSDEINKKMKYLKSVAEKPDEQQSRSSITTAKRPVVRIVEEENGEPKNADESGEADERAILRAKLDKLKQHDLVTHKFFGKGEVYDNSDVKLMEVRFGMDVRYLNKDALAAKNLLTFDDDDSIITRKKL